MRVLINFATLKKGGGQNVALNFLSVVKDKGALNNYFYFVAKNSLIHTFLETNNCTNYVAIPGNPILRIAFEVLCSRSKLKKFKVDVIYTYFGIGIFPRRYPQIIGSADSNLYFPEIDFWKDYHGISLLKKRIIDKYRIWGLYRADGIVFENAILEHKCHELFNLKALTTTILPSISLDFPDRTYQLPIEALSDKYTAKGIFLCGWHMNKNVMIIPLLARKMKDRHIKFHFILTAPNDNSELSKKFTAMVAELDVQEMISVVGTVHKEELKSLYSQVDIVFLLSKLESFSNNIIEAWTFKKVLVVADEPWAQSLCKNAAIYVDRNDVDSIVNAVNNILASKEEYNQIIQKGLIETAAYPTVAEKYEQEISFIKRVYENV